jgi:hypothetical protein
LKPQAAPTSTDRSLPAARRIGPPVHLAHQLAQRRVSPHDLRNMKPSATSNRLTGGLLVAITGLEILSVWASSTMAETVLPWLIILTTLVLALQVRAGRYLFALVALALSAALIATNPDWRDIMHRGLMTAAFITAFFTALATLRSVAETSPAIRASGRFLAQQPPGRRYLALTIGGQMFALLLNYGAIALLGSLATTSANEEKDPEIRRHRTRRMLLAIQRAFTSALPWSPLSFAVAISTALIPGTSWALAVLPGLVTSLLLAATGWVLDAAFKPKLSAPAPVRQMPEGTWALMLPLALLLAILVTSIAVLYAATGIRIVGLVLVIVPVIAGFWLALQARGKPDAPGVGRRVSDYAFVELPAYRGEIILLMMAGYIGTVGAPLLGPVLMGIGLDLAGMPAPLLLISFVWIIPLAGQLGMNPILTVTLLAPLIPEAADLGVTPNAIIVAITSGWALTGVTSPFTATTLLIGSFGRVSARHVGLRWNGAYALVTAVILSGWVALYASL